MPSAAADMFDTAGRTALSLPSRCEFGSLRLKEEDKTVDGVHKAETR